ncbi:MAG: caspase family protein [Bacteroidota bacterium]
MEKGYSLHIGVNQLDLGNYKGSGDLLDLPVCEADAKAMASIAFDLNYQETRVLLTKSATKSKIKRILKRYSKELKAGDALLLTFSGHGGKATFRDNFYRTQIDEDPDKAPDEEPDKEKEYWCLYDGILKDTSLVKWLYKFKKGVKITIVADCCFSAGLIPNFKMNQQRDLPYIGDQVEQFLPGLKAHMYLMCASRESEYAAIKNTAAGYSIFTEQLLEVWASGGYEDSCENFIKDIRRKMPPNQSPQFFKSKEAPASPPFKLNKNGGTSPTT